ncbi:MAG TPA: hypothetical protein VHO25_09580 [Polyangiaceae bacterium]|nr:hypothetical protein [Polyangiaceae bacterium]
MQQHDQTDKKPHENPGPPTVTVKVFSPREPDPKTFTWPQTMRVGDAAAEAALAFGYPSGLTVSFQNKAGEVLDRKKPLVAAGVRDGDTLEIVDVGGGV